MEGVELCGISLGSAIGSEPLQDSAPRLSLTIEKQSQLFSGFAKAARK